MVKARSWLKDTIQVLSMPVEGQLRYLSDSGHFKLSKNIGPLVPENPKFLSYNIEELGEEFADEYARINILGLSDVVKHQIQLLDTSLNKRWGGDYPDFWTVDALYHDPYWDEIRQISRNCIDLMKSRNEVPMPQ